MSKKTASVQTSEQVAQEQQTLENAVQQSVQTPTVENPTESKQALSKAPTASGDLLLKNLNECTAQIQHAMTSVAKAFLYIGFRLWECREDKTYEALGFKNVYEYGEAVLGFKKTSTSNFINVCLRFSEKSTENGLPTYNIHKSVENFSYSQLVEMLSLGTGEAEKVTSEMTVKDIRKLKSGEESGEESGELVQTSEQQKISLTKGKTYTLVLPSEMAAQLDAFVQANRVDIAIVFRNSLTDYLKSFKAPAKSESPAKTEAPSKAPSKISPEAKAFIEAKEKAFSKSNAEAKTKSEAKAPAKAEAPAKSKA